MSNANSVTHSRLSDTLERELLRRSVNESESVTVTPALKSISHGLGKAFSAFTSYMMALTAALNEARAKDVRFSHNQW
jgi:hypothetical protein